MKTIFREFTYNSDLSLSCSKYLCGGVNRCVVNIEGSPRMVKPLANGELVVKQNPKPPAPVALL